MICGTIFGVTCTYLFSTVHVTMQPKSKILLDLIDSIAISPVKLMHLKVFGCYMHGTLKTWSVHPPQPKPELELRAKGQIISKGVFWCLQFLPKDERKHVE